MQQSLKDRKLNMIKKNDKRLENKALSQRKNLETRIKTIQERVKRRQVMKKRLLKNIDILTRRIDDDILKTEKLQLKLSSIKIQKTNSKVIQEINNLPQ